MGLVKCFDQDVFVSYGWMDDEALKGGERNWIEGFSVNLQKRLSQITGNRALLWRDMESLGKNEQIWPAIQRAITRSALFLSVISPRYVKSSSCLRELSHFELVRMLWGGPSVNSLMRAFHVIKLPVKQEEMPQLYRSRNGYEFFQRDQMKGYPLELSPASDLYRERTNELAFDMASVLDQLERRTNA